MLTVTGTACACRSLELCRGNQEEAERYWRRFEKCIVDIDGTNVLEHIMSHNDRLVC